MKHSLLATLALLALISCSNKQTKDYLAEYTGENTEHIAFPLGGLGSGMICFEGSGAISHISLHHAPDLFNEPCMFACLHVDGVENGTKVIEKAVPDYKKYGRIGCNRGWKSAAFGLPRYEDGSFKSRFPFAELKLRDNDLPLETSVVAWNPFIAGDEDSSSLPVAGFEYTFTNNGSKAVDATFSYNTKNFMSTNNGAPAEITAMSNGFVLNQDPAADKPWDEGHFAIFAPDEKVIVDNCWFRGGWYDPMSMVWNKLSNGESVAVEAKTGAPGATLYIPFKLNPGESKTIKLLMAWYVPESNLRRGRDAENASDLGNCHDAELYKDIPFFYKPWYASKFASIDELCTFWKDNYSSLKEGTQTFTDAFYDSTLPSEALRAVSDNLSILKSPTVLRQHDGRLWGWEGCEDYTGSCHGSCTHVWNYAQALPHLFPKMERSLRETEFFVSQNTEGHQMFRSCLPIRPVCHDFLSASDGQLGGIIKAYRDWRISGDNEWMCKLYPQIVQSLDYCIRSWDPRQTGALEEPHHNTYDIEFWGADAMCTTIYASALEAAVSMGKAAGQDVSRYESLLAKSKKYLAEKLWNGEYFIQSSDLSGLNNQDPTSIKSINTYYTEEALELIKQEGPKYQYYTGCLSDGILGSWMALVAGLDEPLEKDKAKSHVNAIYKYNLKKDLFDIANPQRPNYALGHEGGLLLCSWPNGGKPKLPFIYSDEVWTGIEFQVAAHLIFEGEVEKGLDVVRTCLDRYDGKVRDPYDEYECGSYYSRAMSSYSLLQALTGARYDAVEQTLYIDSKVGDNFRSFLSTENGFGTVGLKDGKPFIEVKKGEIPVKKYVVSGVEM